MPEKNRHEMFSCQKTHNNIHVAGLCLILLLIRQNNSITNHKLISYLIAFQFDPHSYGNQETDSATGTAYDGIMQSKIPNTK